MQESRRERMRWRGHAGTMLSIERRFWLQPCCHRQRIFLQFYSLHKDGFFALPNSHFCQPSISGLGLNPTVRIKSMPGLKDSLSWKQIQSSCILWQKHRWKNAAQSPRLILFRPLDIAFASSKLTFCLKIQYTYWEGVQERPFLSLSGVARQKAQQAVSWAEPQPGEDQATWDPPSSAFSSLALCACPLPWQCSVYWGSPVHSTVLTEMG